MSTDLPNRAGEAERRFARERMRVRALQTFAELLSEEWWRGDEPRVSGDMICTSCGFTYAEHPTVLPIRCPSLVVLCDGTLVKL